MSKSFGETNLRRFLLELAYYQDQLLQSYRNIFIASQTIVVSMATLIVAFSEYPLNSTFIFQLIIGVFIIIYWKKITHSRGLDVSYCHLQFEKVEAGKRLELYEELRPFRSFKDWQNKTIKEKERILKKYDKSEKPNRKIFKSYTRNVMGRKLPFIFSIVWGLIFLTFIITMIYKI